MGDPGNEVDNKWSRSNRVERGWRGLSGKRRIEKQALISLRKTPALAAYCSIVLTHCTSICRVVHT